MIFLFVFLSPSFAPHRIAFADITVTVIGHLAVVTVSVQDVTFVIRTLSRIPRVLWIEVR